MCFQSLWQRISSLKVFLLDMSPLNIFLSILLTTALDVGNILRDVGQSDALSSPGTLKKAAACPQAEKRAKYLKQTSEYYDVVMMSSFYLLIYNGYLQKDHQMLLVSTKIVKKNSTVSI